MWRRYLRFWGADPPADVDAEIGFHLEELVRHFVARGMTPDQAERVYQHVYEKISEVVCELPFNYSMADGLLYIARAKSTVPSAP